MDGEENPKEAEAMALKKEMDLALDYYFMEVLFETENKNMANMIMEEENHCIIISIIINNTKKNMKILRGTMACFSNRNTNVAIQILAKHAKFFNNRVWLGETPKCISC